MKKIIVLAIALGLSFASCSKEGDSLSAEALNSGEVSFSASMLSRAEALLFADGDEISISSYSSGGTIIDEWVTYTSDAASSLSSTDPIKKEADGYRGYIASYPKRDGDNFSHTIQSDQSSSDGYKKSDLIVAKESATQSTSISLEFDHTMSQMSIVFDFTDNRIVNLGKAVDISDLKLTLPSGETAQCQVSTTSSSYAASGNGVSISPLYYEDYTYLAILAPQTVEAGVQLASVEIEGNTLTWVCEENNTFESSKSYVCRWKVTITDGAVATTGITINSSIEGWVDGGTAYESTGDNSDLSSSIDSWEKGQPDSDNYINSINLAYPGYLMQGARYTMRAIISPSTFNNSDITWTSSDTSIATVSSSGVVRAVAESSSTVTITATPTDNGNSLEAVSVTLGVIDAKLTSANFSSADVTVIADNAADAITAAQGEFWFKLNTDTDGSLECEYIPTDYGYATVNTNVDGSANTDGTFSLSKGEIQYKNYPFLAIKLDNDNPLTTSDVTTTNKGQVDYNCWGSSQLGSIYFSRYAYYSHAQLTASGTQAVELSGEVNYPYYYDGLSTTSPQVFTYCFQHDFFTQDNSGGTYSQEYYIENPITSSELAANNQLEIQIQTADYNYNIYYMRYFKTEAEMVKFIEEEDAYWAWKNAL